MPIDVRPGLYLSDGDTVATGRSLWEVEGGGAPLRRTEDPLDPSHVRLEVSPWVGGVSAPALGVGREAMTEHRMRLGALRPLHHDRRWSGRGPEGEEVQPSGRGQQRRQCQERHRRGEQTTTPPLPVQQSTPSRRPGHWHRIVQWKARESRGASALGVATVRTLRFDSNDGAASRRNPLRSLVHAEPKLRVGGGQEVIFNGCTSDSARRSCKSDVSRLWCRRWTMQSFLRAAGSEAARFGTGATG